MNKRLASGLLGVFALCGIAGAQADLYMNYVETPVGGGLFSYDITLGVDQSGGALMPGMGWSWIIWGDVANATSPLNDWAQTSPIPAPFENISGTFGYHNGPTWIAGAGNNIVYWQPNSPTDTLTWSGTSAYDASTQGPIYFSELLPEGGAGQDTFKLMNAVPEPAPWLALGVGALGLLVRRRRK